GAHVTLRGGTWRYDVHLLQLSVVRYEVCRGSLKAFETARVAEIVGSTAIVGRSGCLGRIDGHPADRIDVFDIARVGQCFSHATPSTVERLDNWTFEPCAFTTRMDQHLQRALHSLELVNLLIDLLDTLLGN